MGFLDALNTPLTEVPRLDYAIRAHDSLERRFNLLVELLVEKKVLSHDDVAKLMDTKDTAST
jgi:hypothetical protein